MPQSLCRLKRANSPTHTHSHVHTHTLVKLESIVEHNKDHFLSAHSALKHKLIENRQFKHPSLRKRLWLTIIKLYYRLVIQINSHKFKSPNLLSYHWEQQKFKNGSHEKVDQHVRPAQSSTVGTKIALHSGKRQAPAALEPHREGFENGEDTYQ